MDRSTEIISTDHPEWTAIIIPFGIVANRHQIEIVAHELRKPGKKADAYWCAALRHFDRKMAAIGVSPMRRNAELRRLRDGVQAVLDRNAHEVGRRPRGGAA